jgi:hypothetical protein
MRLKEGVVLDRIRPEILRACADIHSLMEATGQFTITAGLDGKHKAGSLHYVGKAVDIRSKHIADPVAKKRVLSEIKNILGRDYDCLLEGEGTENEHYHVEWDKKG